MPEVFKRFKICIFGDGGVGKTSLTHRFLTGIFQDDYTMTIGMDFYVKKVYINDVLLSLQIWDFAGERQFRFLVPSTLYGAHGVIFIYDTTRFSSFKNLENWLDVYNEALKNHSQKIPTVLVGSKIDLQINRSISKEEAINYANKNNFNEYIECSSKTGANVELVFQTMGRIILEVSNSLNKIQ